MIKYRILKILCFFCISILLLSGCNKIINRTAATIPTAVPSIEPSPSTNPTIPTSNPSKAQDKPKNTEDTITTEEISTEVIDNELCGKDEDVLISFKIADSDKIATICLSKPNSDYIIYRYGKPNDIELEYPDTTDSSWDKFTYSYYFRGGGPDNEGIDLNYLDFENDGYRYKIYEEYDSQSDKSMVGITVTNLNTGEETDIQGDNDSRKGSLTNLRDNNKITILIQ
ncbi:MAG: hypothetical protein WBI07_18860 [Mobilitalea sp.]